MWYEYGTHQQFKGWYFNKSSDKQNIPKLFSVILNPLNQGIVCMLIT